MSSAIFNQTCSFYDILDLQGYILRRNRVSREVLPLYEGEHMRFWDAPWWADKAEAKAVVSDALQTAVCGQVFHAELQLFNAQGEKIEADMVCSPLTDDAGEVQYIIMEGRDITAMRNAQRATEEVSALTIIWK